MNELVCIARIGRNVGLKGELKLHNLSDFPNQFQSGSEFILDDGSTISMKSYSSKRELVLFDGYENIEDSKKLINQFLYLSKDKVNIDVLDKNQYFWFDIIGCSIIEDEVNLGIVTDVQRFNKDDYLYIKTSSNLVKQDLSKVFLIPYIKNYIIEVSLKDKIIKTQNALLVLQNS